jgi:hypothetical protein
MTKNRSGQDICVLSLGFDISALNAVSRRDNTIVAWHEVPGKASLEGTVP